MKWRILTIVLSGLLIAAAIGRTFYPTDLKMSAAVAPDGRSPSSQAALQLSVQDGLLEAHADAMTDTVRIKHRDMADASGLLKKVCDVVPAHLSWIKHVRVYPQNTTDLATTLVTPELDQSCL